MIESDAKRPTNVIIDLDKLAYNFHSVKKFVGKEIKYMAVVKANAYGHGAVECAKRLENEGVDWLGVALPEEGLELRKQGIKTPILCLCGFWNGQEQILLENNLTPVIYQLEKAESFNQEARKKGIEAKIHVKIDTGMGRIGVRFDEANNFADGLKEFRNLSVEGIMTHFAAADNLNENDFTNLQISRFDETVKMFESKGFYPKYKDLANSPGAVGHSEARGNLVRIGGILYGLGDDVLPKEIPKPKLKPIMSLRSRIAHIKLVPKGETLGYGRTFQTKKDSKIATIPIGYQDGYNRALSNRGRVIINGEYAPIVGRISMDWSISDVTNIQDVKVNDEVILIGEKDKLRITAEELAEKIDTISYEVTCGINSRVNRVYVGSQKK